MVQLLAERCTAEPGPVIQAIRAVAWVAVLRRITPRRGGVQHRARDTESRAAIPALDRRIADRRALFQRQHGLRDKLRLASW
jgi:hypothetical protein